MAELTFDPQVVSQCAQDISSHQKNIMSLVNQASSQASGLSDWQGQAAEQFRATFNQMAQKLNDGNNVISTYVQFLNQALEDWETTNSQITEDVSSFEGGN